MPATLPRDYDPTVMAGLARSASESLHPNLWRGLEGAWSPMVGNQGDTRLTDLSGRGRHGVLGGSFLPSYQVSDRGISQDYVTTSDGSRIDADLPDIQEPFSLVAFYRLDTTAQHCLVSLGSNSATTYYALLTDATVPARARHFDGTLSEADSSVTHETGVWYSAAAVFRSLSSRTIWLNGIASTTNTDTRTHVTIDRMTMGQTADSTPFAEHDGLLNIAMVYSRALTQPELRLLAVDPLALFRLRQELSPVPIVAAASGSVQSLIGPGGLISSGGLAGNCGGLIG